MALFAPLVVFPLVARPLYGIALTLAVTAVALAWRSVAWPIVLAGAPAILIGLLGRNPFPNGAIAMSLFAWTLLAVAIAGARGNAALTFRSLLNAPVVATIVLAILLIARLGGSPAYAYGSVKAQLFVAENLFGLIAGMAIARHARHFRILTTGLVAVATITAVVLANGLASGQLEATVGGRFSIDQEASPIGLGRAAAQGILVAVFLVLAAGPPLVRLLAVGAMPLIAVSFIAAGSRGPVLGLVVGVIVLLALALRDRQSRLRIALVAVGGVAGALLVTQLVPGQDVQRSLSVLTGSGNGLSSNGRDLLWQQAWQLFRQHPLFGVGTGGFASFAPTDLYPHNLFLELGSEVGIVGVLAVAVVLIGGVVALRRADRAADGALGAEVGLVAALLVAAFVNAQVSSAVTENAAIWVAVGLALGLAQRVTTTGALPERARAIVPRRRERVVTRSALAGRPQQGWQSRTVDRQPGEIVLPREGAAVGGVVTVAGRPAKTGWGVRSVQLEVATDGGEWEQAAAVAIAGATVVARVSDGFREEVALVRSDHVAQLLAAELSELDGGDYVLDRAARRPWASDSWSVDWDTNALPDGAYALRIVTLDMAGIRTASPIRHVTVSAAAAPEHLVDRRRGVETLWERLTAREAELARLEQALAARSDEVTRLAADARDRSSAIAERARELESQGLELEELTAAHAAAAAELRAREAKLEQGVAANEAAGAELVEERRRLAALDAQLEQLQRGLAARSAELQRLETEYAARSEELIAREREAESLRAELEEARAAQATAAVELERRERDVEARRSELVQLEQRLAGMEEQAAVQAAAAAELERRQQLVVQRETATAAAAGEVARREREADSLRAELEEARAAQATAAVELEHRAAELAAQGEALREARETQAASAADIERRSSELAAREERLTRREAGLVARVAHALPQTEQAPAPEPELESEPMSAPPLEPAPPPVVDVAVPAPEPVPERAPVLVAAAPPELTLWVLESRIAESPHPDPMVQEEREATLFALRSYADSNGRIPPQFEQMVFETFGDLIGELR